MVHYILTLWENSGPCFLLFFLLVGEFVAWFVDKLQEKSNLVENIYPFHSVQKNLLTYDILCWDADQSRLAIFASLGAVHFLTCTPCWSVFIVKGGNASYPTTEKKQYVSYPPLGVWKMFHTPVFGNSTKCFVPPEKKCSVQMFHTPYDKGTVQKGFFMISSCLFVSQWLKTWMEVVI